jgi:hypothetical protein
MVFDGPEDYHARIDDPALGIDENTMLFMRGTGPIGYPGGAEVVNMQPPAYLIKKGVCRLPCIGDGRQSGTSGSPSILNASPEAASAAGWRCSRPATRCASTSQGHGQHPDPDGWRRWLKERAQRRRPRRAATSIRSSSQTPWQEIQRGHGRPAFEGMVLKPAGQVPARPVLIEPKGKGMLLTTLRYDANVVSQDAVFSGIDNVEVDEEMIDLATHIIDKKTAHFDPKKYEDRYETALLELVRSKQDGETVTASRPAARKDNVVNLFDALKKSLAEEDGDGAKTPKRKGKAKAEPKAERKSA